MDCIGGLVVSLTYGLQYSTGDIDVFEVRPPSIDLGMAAAGGPLHRRYGVYLERVGIPHVPENYEERLSEMFSGQFKHLQLMAADPYDLALSKLERNSEKDREHVLHLARAIPLDPKILEERYHRELRWQVFVPEREDTTLRLWLEMIEEERSASRKREAK